MNDTLISVIIPVFNGEEFIQEAIESIFSQKYHPIEIIIIDDGSKDSTKKIVSQFPEIQYHYQTNQGPAKARNVGLSFAGGSLIAFLDADDYWSDQKLDIQFNLMKNNPSVDIVLGHVQFICPVQKQKDNYKYVPYLQPWMAPSLGNALIKRSVFDLIGNLDEEQFYCDDIDWFKRVREKNLTILEHNDVTYYYRRHENNITNNDQLGKQFLLQAVKKSLDRKRNI
jgi:glycosyltransferase involved in cell wall biosynthesis